MTGRTSWRSALLTVLVLGLLGAHPSGAEAAGQTASKEPKYKHALRIARHQIGDRYKYGAEGPNRFDCSGLVYYSTHKAGLTGVPRTSADQADYMRRIPRKHLRRGDFVFFHNKSGVYHVGFFVGRSDGDVYIVHAPSPGTRVRRERVWTDSWFAGTLRR